jgi:hypothetical protein
MVEAHVHSDWEFHGLTSKMSHGLLGRGSCLKTIWILLFQFEHRYDSTRRDRAGRWLWRLVGLFLSTAPPHDSVEYRVHQLPAIQTSQERLGYVENLNGLGMPLHPSILLRL